MSNSYVAPYRNIAFKSVSESQKQRVKEWWSEFERKRKLILQSFQTDSQIEFDLPKWIADNLQIIDPNIMWEFGPGIEKDNRLVITPESHRNLRPLVRYILQQAPELDDFEFYEYRLPETFDDVSAMMDVRTNWNDISGIEFDLSMGRYNRIDIMFYTPFDEPENDQLNKLYVLTEQLLGEENLDKWLGYLDVKRLPRAFFKTKTGKYTSIRQLENKFNDEIKSIKSSLPDSRYCDFAETGEWILVKLNPEKSVDYAFKSDMFVSPFLSELLFSALHSGKNSFYSGRFSKFDEQFIFIKMDGSADDVGQEIFEDRSGIEDALNNALVGTGCVVGGGTGFRYSYIDLAVNDVDGAIDIVKSVLQKGKLTKRSWILFHDPDYKSEWIGVWPDGPEPCMETFE